MQTVVYRGGKIVKWYNGTRQQCKVYMHGAAEGLEASGARLSFATDTGNPDGVWHGYTSFGSPVLIFVWEPK